MFMLNNAHGDVRPDGRGLGLYLGDTRFLSTYDLLLNGIHPVVLRAGPAAPATAHDPADQPGPASTTARDDRTAMEVVLRRHSLGVVRDRSSATASASASRSRTTRRCPERARLTLALDADYADIFELRGLVRARRGERLANEWTTTA